MYLFARTDFFSVISPINNRIRQTQESNNSCDDGGTTHQQRFVAMLKGKISGGKWTTKEDEIKE